MPTGYTYKVCEGEVTELKDYILDCARAFCVHMRDSDSDVVTERIPSKYHQSATDNAVLEYQKWFNMKDKDWEHLQRKQVDAHNKYNLQCYNDKVLENKRLDTMKEKVEQWAISSADYIPFKDFLLQELTISYNNLTYYTWKPTEFVPLEEFKTRKLKELLDEISYHSNEYKKELERCEKTNAWIKGLVENIKGE